MLIVDFETLLQTLGFMNLGFLFLVKKKKKFLLLFALRRLQMIETNQELCSFVGFYEHYKLLLFVMVVRLSIYDDFELRVGGFLFNIVFVSLCLLFSYHKNCNANLRNKVVYACSMVTILHVHV